MIPHSVGTQAGHGSHSAPSIRETGIAQVMTSTSIGEHPTAFYSTGLPILQVALSVEAMSGILRPMLEAAGADGAPSVRYAKLLAYKQGNRGIVHYDVADGPVGPSTVVLGKLYPGPTQAARVFEIMRALDRVFAEGRELSVPKPLGIVPELAMLVYVPTSGRFLDEVVLQGAGRRSVELAATWLHMLHSSELPLDRRLDLSTEAVNIRAWTALVAHAHPDQRSAVMLLGDRLRRMAKSLMLEVTGPVHKDFHYRHVLVGDDVSVIDFDEVRRGDPTLDVAHFFAHLRLLAARTPEAPGETFVELGDAFLDTYARLSGWRADDRFPFFRGYTALKVAKQLCTTRGVRPRPEGEEALRQLRIMLDEGVAAVGSL